MDPNFIKISEKTDSNTQEILKAYWSMDNGKFANKPSELSRKYQSTIYAINKLVKEHSSCKKLLGYCVDCKIQITETVHSQTAYNYQRTTKRCEGCTIANKRRLEQAAYLQQQEQAHQTKERFNKAISDKNWLKLSSNELDLLSKILEFKSKKLIYTHVFNGNPQDKSIWIVMNKLEKLGLININRNALGSISHFSFDPQLESEITSSPELKKQF